MKLPENSFSLALTGEIFQILIKICSGGAFSLLFGNNPAANPIINNLNLMILEKTRVFARMAPEQKKNLICYLRKTKNPLDLISKDFQF